MNLREGTRRLALLLGVVGALLGVSASVMFTRDVLSQRVRHAEFEQLAAGFANSRFAQQMRQDAEHDPSEASIMPGCCGIEEIVWDKNHVFNDPSGVYSITTDGGQTVYPTRAPAVWTYLLIALFPVIGFFIPWIAIRAIGWVGSGFSQPPR